MALTFSRKLLRPLEGTDIQSALNSALNKVASALPPQGHEYVRALDNLFSIGLGPHKNYHRYKKTIDLITQAIDKLRTAQIRYFSASRGTGTRREVDPYRLWYAGGGLYLIGYCHLRKDVRLFAVERIRSITLTDHPYQAPGVQRGGLRPRCADDHERKADRGRASVFEECRLIKARNFPRRKIRGPIEAVYEPMKDRQGETRFPRRKIRGPIEASLEETRRHGRVLVPTLMSLQHFRFI